MFGLSFPELLVIFGVALVVIGPRQLPVVASRLGKVMGQLRRQTDSLRREFYNSVYTPAQELNKVTRELRSDFQRGTCEGAPAPTPPPPSKESDGTKG